MYQMIHLRTALSNKYLRGKKMPETEVFSNDVEVISDDFEVINNDVNEQIAKPTTPSTESESYEKMISAFAGDKNVLPTRVFQLEKEWIDNLKPEDMEEIIKIKDGIELSSDGILVFGSDVQSRMGNTNSVNILLNKSVTNDIGQAGDALKEAIIAIKHHGEKPTNNPLVKLFRKIQHYGEDYVISSENLGNNITTLQQGLKVKANDMLELAKTFKNLNEDNTQAYYELNQYIYAGQLKIEEVCNELEETERKFERNELSPIEEQEYLDKKASIDELTRRIDDLYCTRFLTIIQVPEIRAITYNAREIASKLVSVAVNIGPILQMQCAIAVGNSALNNGVTTIDVLNSNVQKLLISNTESMKLSADKVTRATESSLINSDTIKAMQNNIFDTYEKSTKIIEETKKKRLENQQAMLNAEKLLKEASRRRSSNTQPYFAKIEEDTHSKRIEKQVTSTVFDELFAEQK